jgi:hypothetical protein
MLFRLSLSLFAHSFVRLFANRLREHSSPPPYPGGGDEHAVPPHIPKGLSLIHVLTHTMYPPVHHLAAIDPQMGYQIDLLKFIHI